MTTLEALASRRPTPAASAAQEAATERPYLVPEDLLIETIEFTLADHVEPAGHLH